ncbi:MAG: hypothetical protein E2O52_08975 [Gammaproteobacteria bacterium]|nr:MAG: hypothetical protein E2O52_08975 [Gammaproteobacteria bacterium]
MTIFTASPVRRLLVCPGFYDIRFSLLLVLTGMALSSIAAAATVTVTPSRDATIFSSGGVNGIGDLFAGTSGTITPSDQRRALLYFDLAAIPADAVITDVSLTLSVLAAQGSETGSLHRLLQAWAEGDQAAGAGAGIGAGGGGGAPSSPVGDNDVTWTTTGLGPAWANAGADFIPAASGSALLPLAGNTVTFSSAGMASDVQGWVDASFGNFGWIITGSDIAPNVRKFASREAVSGQPELSVTYNVIPIPAAVWLFGSALGLLGWMRH